MLERTASQHVSSFDLDLLEAGGLDDAKKQSIDEHLRTCAVCRQDQQSMREARAHFSEKVLPRTAERIRERAGSTARPFFRRPEVFGPLLASAAALLLWIGKGSVGPRGAEVDDVQAKGQAALTLVARHEGRVVPLDPSHRTLAAGDEVRFVVTVADRALSYLLIASVDGRGRASVYFPYGGTESRKLEHPGRIEVPGSVVLDDAPGPERVFALLSKEPISAETATRALAALGRRGWDAVRTTERVDLGEVDQSSFLIEKSAPSAP